MRKIRTLLFVLSAILLVASPAAALVTVEATLASAAPGGIGQTFDVDISVTWDGSGTLNGIFASHTWDSSQLTLVSAVFPLALSFETAPSILIGGMFDANLSRFGTIASGIAGDDLSSSARTVQYGSVSPVPASSAQTSLVTRLTFQLIGIGSGPIAVTGQFLPADIGANGDSFAFSDLVIVPEPGTVLLMGLGLLGLGLNRRQNG